MKAAILVALALVTLAFALYWAGKLAGDQSAPVPRPTPASLAIGFVTNFFDTLGIGSFAPTTALFRLLRVVPDEQIPGTLNVGHALPTIAQAFVFIVLVPVEIATLIAMVLASVLGAWLGAGVVAGWPRRRIQLGLGTALLIAAILFAMTGAHLLPGGGTARGLSWPLLVVASVANFVLGGLMTLGIGLYAPGMILIGLLGMHPASAFPIMTASCAFLMPAGSVRFIQRKSYSAAVAIGITVGGVPAVLLAAYIVKSLPLGLLRWLVVGVVLYTAITLLRAGRTHEGRNP